MIRGAAAAGMEIIMPLFKRGKITVEVRTGFPGNRFKLFNPGGRIRRASPPPSPYLDATKAASALGSCYPRPRPYGMRGHPSDHRRRADHGHLEMRHEAARAEFRLGQLCVTGLPDFLGGIRSQRVYPKSRRDLSTPDASRDRAGCARAREPSRPTSQTFPNPKHRPCNSAHPHPFERMARHL